MGNQQEAEFINGELRVQSFWRGHDEIDSRMSPDVPRGTYRLIGGHLDIDGEGSKQRWFEPVQSLHHSSVGYQPMHTQIGLAKKAMSLQAN
jgi:hypothetical protein